MKAFQNIFAVSLALLTIGSLAACNFEQTRQVGQQPGAESERGATDETAEGRAAVQEEAGLNDLEPGQNLAYYNREFERRGFEVYDVKRRGDNEMVYDLRRDDERYHVRLTRRGDEVSDVEVQQAQRLGEQQRSQNQQVAALVQEIQNLQPGKKPTEYINQLSEHGKVTEFNWDDDKAEIQLETRDKRASVEIQMQVNPQTEQVTRIDVEEDDIWTL